MSSEPALSSDPAHAAGTGLSVPYGKNAARVLGLLRLAGRDGADRNELALRTGLTPQAVSKITARLRSHGLVTEAGRRASTGGKPSTVLRLAPGARHAVGVQLDRDQLTAVLVDLSGGVVAGRTAPLDMGADAEGLLDAVESAVNGLIGAGLPVLGGRPGGTPGREGAGGGELWQQASEGEVWKSRHAGAGVGAVEEPSSQERAARAAEARSADARRAVAEEGELWQERTRGEEAGAETEAREPGPEPGEAAPEEARPAETGAEPAAGRPAAEAGGELGAGPEPGVGVGREPGSGGAQTEGGTGPPELGGRWGAVVGVGVAAPGPLDPVRGVLGQVTGFPRWAGFPLRDALAGRLGMPVVVDKDTNAAAMGLALRGKESLAYIHFGTGLGAGLVLDGSIHRGNRNGAGEFGHQVIELDGTPCRCGRNGCLEALCLDAVRRGRAAEAARLLGVGAANLVNLLDVDRVLLGGSTVLADPDTYLDGVTAQLCALPGAARAAGSHRTAGAPGAAAREASAPREAAEAGTSAPGEAADSGSSASGASSASGRPATAGSGSSDSGGSGPSGPAAAHASGARADASGARAAPARTAGAVRSPVRVELVPEGSRTVADGAAQLVLAPLFGRAPGAPATAR